MSNNNTNNKNDKKPKMYKCIILIDIGATILVAAGGAVLGEVSHRVKEVKSRKKAKDLAVKRNNEERGDE